MSPITAEDEFLLALTTVRATYGTASVDENDLKDIVSTEESRIADAAVLAELISTRLGAVQAQSPATTGTAPQAAPNGKTAAPNLPTPIPFPSGCSTPPLSIADLIDGMLTQEKRDVRTASKP
jgi:hypothetical protein